MKPLDLYETPETNAEIQRTQSDQIDAEFVKALERRLAQAREAMAELLPMAKCYATNLHLSVSRGNSFKTIAAIESILE